MTYDFVDLGVCSDCLMWLANGDEPDDNPQGWAASLLDRTWPSAEGWHLGVGRSGELEEDEGSFSWWPCEACCRQLGGMRYGAHALKREG